MKKQKFRELDAQGRATLVLGYAVLVLSMLFTALVIIGRFIPAIEANGIYRSIDIFNRREGVNAWLLSLSYIVSILTISYALRMLVGISFRWVKRGGAVISLLSSFLKYIAVIVIAFFVLSAFGIDTQALIAGIGILSLVVGLAIQPLLQDIIAGMFVVFEKTYDVGDVVVVDGFRGTVTEIGIRTTKLRDAGGDVKVINNSDIRTLVNMTSELSVAICDVDIQYEESLERVENIIKDNLDTIREKIPAIKDGPYYKGVTELGASGVRIRLIAQCPEDEKFQTQRDMNRQIKLIFDKNNVNIPYQQVVIHGAEKEKRHTPSASTDDFIIQQNALSRDLGEEEK